MLKNLGYGGTYHDQKISLGVLLENPSDYNLEAATLVFSVTLRNKQESAANQNLQDFSFYIMDEHNPILQRTEYTRP